ncbi:MAG: hypothetical protein EU539_03435 [Promethearchaeota archaeon]|nr:MAG: hypothetical protein EU539_03435 [Candidatus Lokiarchaeota archaeon]
MTQSGFNSELEGEIRTFKDLEKEVINAGECCSCGACIAYCESQSFDVIELDEYTPRFKSDKNAENCTECGLCYFICPQTHTILPQLEEKHQIEDELGHIIDLFAAKSQDDKMAEFGQDGGVITSILAYLFDHNKIDAAIVSEFDEHMKPIPKLIFDKKELVKSAGTRYSISPNILPLKDLYNIPEEIIEQKGIYDIEQLRLAFVGTPCQCRAINKMKFLNVKPAHVIKYVIGLFCFENFNYENLMEVLKKETNVDPSNIKKTTIKKNFFLTSKDDKQFEIDIKVFDKCVRDHCHKCDEFTAKFTDISVGASGAPDGYSMVITRTDKGHELAKSLLSRGYITEYVLPAEKSKEWKQKKKDLYRKMISYKVKLE